MDLGHVHGYLALVRQVAVTVDGDRDRSRGEGRHRQQDLAVRVGQPADRRRAYAVRADHQAGRGRHAGGHLHGHGHGPRRQLGRVIDGQEPGHTEPDVGGRVADEVVPHRPDGDGLGLARLVVHVELGLAQGVGHADAVVVVVEQPVPGALVVAVVVAGVGAAGRGADGRHGATVGRAQEGFRAADVVAEGARLAGGKERHGQTAAVLQVVDVAHGQAAHVVVAAIPEHVQAGPDRGHHLEGEVAAPHGVDLRPAQRFELALEPLVHVDDGRARVFRIADQAGAAVPAGVAHGRRLLVVHDLGDHDLQLEQRLEGQTAHVDVAELVAAVEPRVVVVALAAVAGEAFGRGHHEVGPVHVPHEGHELQGRDRVVVVEGLQRVLDHVALVADHVHVEDLDVVALAAAPLDQRREAVGDGPVAAADDAVGAGERGRGTRPHVVAGDVVAHPGVEGRGDRAGGRFRCAAGEGQFDLNVAGDAGGAGEGVVGHGADGHRHDGLAGHDGGRTE